MSRARSPAPATRIVAEKAGARRHFYVKRLEPT